MEHVVIQVLGCAVGKFFVDGVAEGVVEEFCTVVFGDAVIVYFALVAVDNVVCGVEGEQAAARFFDLPQQVIFVMYRTASLVCRMGKVAGFVVAVTTFDCGLGVFAFAAFGQAVEC